MERMYSYERFICVRLMSPRPRVYMREYTTRGVGWICRCCRCLPVMVLPTSKSSHSSSSSDSELFSESLSEPLSCCESSDRAAREGSGRASRAGTPGVPTSEGQGLGLVTASGPGLGVGVAAMASQGLSSLPLPWTIADPFSAVSAAAAVALPPPAAF